MSGELTPERARALLDTFTPLTPLRAIRRQTAPPITPARVRGLILECEREHAALRRRDGTGSVAQYEAARDRVRDIPKDDLLVAYLEQADEIERLQAKLEGKTP